MAAESNAEGGAGQRALALAAGARNRFAAMPAPRRTWLMVGGIAMLAAIATMVWYAQRPDYRILFSGLEGKDVQQVAQELGAAGIPFEMTSDGSGVEVPTESLSKARMEVAAKGMPQSGRLGFELFDKPNWVGSEFDERVNYQRALEGELEHTIATLGAVRSARVHLVLPQSSVFSSEQRVAKASVVLKLKRTTLDPEQTESIRNLVAGAVENLNPAQVTLVDADGRANLNGKAHGAVAGDEERALEGKLVAMLEPLAGAGNVRATVNMVYDEGTEERTDEVYDPAQTATLSSQKTKQVSGGSRAAQGVPGTASNTPAAAPPGAVQGSVKAAAPGTPPLLQPASQAKDALPVYPQTATGSGQTVKEESGTYAVTRHLLHSELGPGRLRRLTAAVVVNDRMSTEGVAKTMHTVWKPRSSEEMHRLEGLAQAAVGYEPKRGDQVTMENVSFSSNAPELEKTGADKALEQATGLLNTQPAVLKTAVTGLLGLLLVWFVLRPVARQLVVAMGEPIALTSGYDVASGGTARVLAGGSGVSLDSGGAGSLADGLTAADEHHEARMLDAVTRHIKQEPAHSTRLLESWISAEGDA